MKIFLGTLILAFILPTFANAATSPETPNQYQTQPVRLACGESRNVWAYVASTLGSSAVHKDDLPPISDENARYYVDSSDGSWLILVEYTSDQPDQDNLACIIAKGSVDMEIQTAMKLPVAQLPRQIISPAWAGEHPQFTWFDDSE